MEGVYHRTVSALRIFWSNERQLRRYVNALRRYPHNNVVWDEYVSSPLYKEWFSANPTTFYTPLELRLTETQGEIFRALMRWDTPAHIYQGYNLQAILGYIAQMIGTDRVFTESQRVMIAQCLCGKKYGRDFLEIINTINECCFIIENNVPVTPVFKKPHNVNQQQTQTEQPYSVSNEMETFLSGFKISQGEVTAK